MRWLGPVLVLLVAVGTLTALAFTVRADTRPVIVIADVINATGDESYAPLARATSELVVADLAGRGFQVRRQGQGDVQLAIKLVLWNGQPSLGLTATDQSGVVQWSGMTSGSAEQVPAAVKAELNELQAKLSPS